VFYFTKRILSNTCSIPFKSSGELIIGDNLLPAFIFPSSTHIFKQFDGDGAIRLVVMIRLLFWVKLRQPFKSDAQPNFTKLTSHKSRIRIEKRQAVVFLVSDLNNHGPGIDYFLVLMSKWTTLAITFAFTGDGD
jgi:hypothetical protein